MKILSIPAWQIGLPVDDLSFGIAWSTDNDGNERGMLLAGRQENRRHYYVLLMAKDDPREQTDVLWELSTHSLVHEIIHYFDYGRGFNAALYRRKQWQSQRERDTGTRPTEKPRTRRTYYNDPLEFNAHFHQAVAELFNTLASNIAQRQHFGAASEVAWLRSFTAFYERFTDIADRQKYLWLPGLTRRNKQKVIRRLFKLYSLLRRGWPSLQAIQKQADAFVARWREEDEQREAA